MALEPEKPKPKPEELPHIDDALNRARLPAVRVALKDRPVLLVQDGIVSCGVNVQHLALRQLTEGTRSMGQPGFSEVVFRTLSGNSYRLHRLQCSRWAIKNARRDVESYVPDREVWDGVLEVGKRFSHNGRNTAHVSQIVAMPEGQSVSGRFDLSSVFGAAIRHGKGEVLFLPSYREVSQSKGLGNPAVCAEFSRQRRPVLVLSGASLLVGSERAGLYLRELLASPDYGTQGPRELIFRTVSGNLYGILRGAGGAAVLVNSRGVAPVILTDEDLTKKKIAVGHRFVLDDGKSSSIVSHIISISGSRCPLKKVDIESIRKLALDLSNGNVSFSREELLQSVIKNVGRDEVKKLFGTK